MCFSKDDSTNGAQTEAAGVPAPVYIVFIVMMGIGAIAAFLLQPPDKIIRDDGTLVATIKPRSFLEELKANLEIFKDWKLLMMVCDFLVPCLAFTYGVQVPAFLPAECFLVYGGSVNAFHNNLRTRCLLSFIAVVLQIPAGYLLQLVLDHKICQSCISPTVPKSSALTSF